MILDDLEADFFTQDQLQLIRRFVATRGGGLLLMGGMESFDKRRFAVGPLAELSPVYASKSVGEAISPEYRFSITREGLLQPWLRLRDTEAAEQQRLAMLPRFNTVNPIGGIKPGAISLATVRDNQGQEQPAMVMQRFGSGKTAAMLLADAWRWPMRRSSPDDRDAGQFWRQICRWLVSEVPQRVQVAIEPVDQQAGLFRIAAQVNDENYLPLDNARLSFKVHRAAELGSQSAQVSTQTQVQPLANGDRAGLYEGNFFTRQTGGYLVTVQAVAPDGTEIGEAKAGWSAQPEQAEFRQWQIDRRA